MTSPNTTSIVSCRHLSKAFEALRVVDDLSFDVAPGNILALLGPSGCGKTTTLRLVAGLEKLDRGEISIAGRLVADGRAHVPTERRNVGLVFQDYAIFPHLSVADNIAFGLERRGADGRVAEMLALVGLQGQGARMPHELSGGQQQRVALARALAPQPAVLLLDEPFSNLDAALRVTMRQEVRALLKAAEMTAIFVTHDQEEALFMGDKVAVMNGGKLEQIGTPEAVFHRPRTRFVADFIGQTDFLAGTIVGDKVITPLGTVPNLEGWAEGAPVELALRPDDVRLEVAAEGNGRILDRQFVGIAYIYHVGLAGGEVVRSWQPHTMHLKQGEVVQATLAAEEGFPIFLREL